MATIKITCETCQKTHEVRRTNEIPEHVVSMGCNWCPECEDRAEDYYEEWYNDGDNGNGFNDLPDNQLVMPFIIQEINDNVETKKERIICA
jgi:hypothetical protein